VRRPGKGALPAGLRHLPHKIGAQKSLSCTESHAELFDCTADYFSSSVPGSFMFRGRVNVDQPSHPVVPGVAQEPHATLTSRHCNSKS
jgi:hypothetical protein